MKNKRLILRNQNLRRRNKPHKLREKIKIGSVNCQTKAYSFVIHLIVVSKLILRNSGTATVNLLPHRP